MKTMEKQPNHQESRENIYPEIRVARPDESGDLISLSILKRLSDEGWGKDVLDNEISKAKISPESINKYKAFLEKADEESLDWIAFVRKRSLEEKQLITDKLVEHKDLTPEEAKDLFEAFSLFLTNFVGDNESIINKAESASVSDMEEKMAALEVINGDLILAVDFFNSAFGSKEVVLLPCSSITPYEQGFCIDMDGTAYVYSSREKSGKVNRLNIIHEYLHTVINSITRRIKLTDREKETIIAMAGERFRAEGYGDDPESLLNESIIRNYGIGPAEIDEEGSNTGDKLGERVLGLLKGYKKAKDNNQDLSFDNYFLDNYKDLFV